MTTIRAHFDGKTFVPDEPVSVPANTPLVLQIQSESRSAPSAEAIEQLLLEMDGQAEAIGHFVDYSRDSIYSGTLDDPR